MPRKNTPESFWSRVDKNGPNGCWLWTGYLNEDGYGRFSWNGSLIMAHRLAHKLLKGPIPEGFELCHSCDNPACVNVEQHTFLGTHLDNINDRKSKGRTTTYPGERNPRAKLNWEKVNEIRTLYATGEYTKTALSKRFSIGYSQVGRILAGTQWV